ncbi:N-acetylglucosamine kinase [Paenibacillus riograndensis]|uniref:BadF/BadG/BcrA/BcrD ATPase family protein n=1 Tax=Paenibacillus riograndensis SBR5 TaxID=1073571 RepID=A0A0E4HFS6_9BACL|nr:BadF/BadG/BcrA/BcrD ATPase family protein [Paenibacillus riograndensis]CQR58904.1 BadF/BadG/BcrA/BcrD ATPase family protein [Paenibacillus riograndensis SBR5]
MLENQEVVIGVDGGGTHTRVMVSSLDGCVLSYVESGAAWVQKDLQATHNVKQAIQEALQVAGRTLGDVRGLAAGIAGYDSQEDLEWVQALTAVEGLDCPKWHYNDAVAAHYGALLTKPGIVALSGTGSIIMAMKEDGQYLRNYDFHHYTGSGARFLAYDAAYEMLAGHTDETDREMIKDMLCHWGAGTIQELWQLARTGFIEDRRNRDRKFEQFAPFITEAASKGSSLAGRVSDRAIYQLKVGIELLAPFVAGETVLVSFIGSVINSSYFKEKLSALLMQGSSQTYTIVEPRFTPVTGSVLYAISRVTGHGICEEWVHNLDRGSQTHPGYKAAETQQSQL